MAKHKGACHCGNLTLVFATDHDPAKMDVRLCQCSFCVRHGARATTDPEGKLELAVKDEKMLHRYRFGLSTADFWLCKKCGCYVAATIETERGLFATLNLNVLDDAALFTKKPKPVVYDAETEEERTARREARWTPAKISAKRSPAKARRG